MKLTQFLQDSAATPAFREAAEAFLATGRPSPTISFQTNAPGVKVERTLTKILEAYPDLPIESVAIEGRSGCEFFRGEAVLRAAEQVLRIRFEWNCKWKANQLGWTDYFGFPDQMRAAREFGFDCFRTWEEDAVEEMAKA